MLHGSEDRTGRDPRASPDLSVYVKRVREEGRAYEVTERGEPVARLTPLEDRPVSILGRMVAEERATPATRDIASLPPMVPGRYPCADSDAEMLRLPRHRRRRPRLTVRVTG